MATKVPDETILAFSRTISQEAHRYGFGQIDFVRLINALMDVTSSNAPAARPSAGRSTPVDNQSLQVDEFPLASARVRIRRADPKQDLDLLDRWMQDDYGKHFLLSCSTAQPMDLAALLANPCNRLGIVMLPDETPIGCVAFLDLDAKQRRAELRKLIGVGDARGKGLAEEATTLWIKYGCERLNVEKFYVSTLQTHLRNIRLNESIGFRVEGVLQEEVRIGDDRHDVLRMGLTAERFRSLLATGG